MIAPTTPISLKQCRVRLQNPGEPIPDGRGGFTVNWFDLDPFELDAHIAPATAADLERATGGTVVSSATHVVALAYHPQITTKTRMTYQDPVQGERIFTVSGAASPNERRVETRLLCNEVVA